MESISIETSTILGDAECTYWRLFEHQEPRLNIITTTITIPTLIPTATGIPTTMGVAMDLPTTVAGSAVLDSVGMAGLATASEVADFTGAVTGNPLRQFDPTRGA